VTTRILLHLIVLLGALVAAESAAARSYDVYSCAGWGNNAWAFATDSPGTVQQAAACPPGSDPYGGIRVFDRIGGSEVPDTPQGRFAHWTFAAPAGTRISALRYQRNVGKEGTDSWSVFTRTGDGTVLDTCSLGMASSCRLGGPTAFPSLNTDRLTVGFSCQVTVGTVCANGFSRHAVWAAIHQSTVTVEDPSSPTLSASGPLWSAGPHRGTVPVTVQAADNSGILETRVFVDGRFEEQLTQPCDVTYPVPCPSAPAVTHSLDTARFANGSHRLEVQAYDTAGNVARTERTVTFDNPDPRPATGPAPSAPRRPGAPSRSTGAGRRTPRLRVTRAVRRGTRVRVTASLDSRARGLVTVTAGGRRSRLRPERGRLSVTLTLRKRGAAVLTLSYPGDSTFGAQRVSRRV
jgi:hypothetical protein